MTPETSSITSASSEALVAGQSPASSFHRKSAELLHPDGSRRPQISPNAEGGFLWKTAGVVIRHAYDHAFSEKLPFLDQPGDIVQNFRAHAESELASINHQVVHDRCVVPAEKRAHINWKTSEAIARLSKGILGSWRAKEAAPALIRELLQTCLPNIVGESKRQHEVVKRTLGAIDSLADESAKHAIHCAVQGRALDAPEPPLESQRHKYSSLGGGYEYQWRYEAVEKIVQGLKLREGQEISSILHPPPDRTTPQVRRDAASGLFWGTGTAILRRARDYAFSKQLPFSPQPGDAVENLRAYAMAQVTAVNDGVCDNRWIGVSEKRGSINLMTVAVIAKLCNEILGSWRATEAAPELIRELLQTCLPNIVNDPRCQHKAVLQTLNAIDALADESAKQAIHCAVQGRTPDASGPPLESAKKRLIREGLYGEKIVYEWRDDSVQKIIQGLNLREGEEIPRVLELKALQAQFPGAPVQLSQFEMK